MIVHNVNYESKIIDNKKLVSKLERIAREYDIALLDTSVFMPPPTISVEERDLMMKICNIKNRGNTTFENVNYMRVFYNYISSNKNIFITSKVLSEIYWDKKTPKKITDEYKKIKKLMEKKVLTFNKHELINLKIIKNKLAFLEEQHKLSGTDYDLLCQTINSGVYKGSTVLLANDSDLLRATIRYMKNINPLESLPYVKPCNPIHLMTTLERKT